MPDWTYSDVPDLSGKKIVVTGANLGLGKALVDDLIHKTKCEKVILACRSKEKAEAAIAELGGDERMEFLKLDLADLDQVRAAAKELSTRLDRIDALVLNAGCLNQQKTTTSQGFETTIGVCHFGHFVFTAKLWPLLRAAPHCRIVPVSSIGHTWTKTGIDLKDLSWQTRKYDQFEAYFQAKLANVYFSKEIAKRVTEAGIPNISSISNSPGYGASGPYRDVPCIVRLLTPCVSESCEKLSINTLRAATDMSLPNGAHLNPKRMNFYGPPIISDVSKLGKDSDIACKLWATTEELTGEKFEIKY